MPGSAVSLSLQGPSSSSSPPPSPAGVPSLLWLNLFDTAGRLTTYDAGDDRDMDAVELALTDDSSGEVRGGGRGGEGRGQSGTCGALWGASRAWVGRQTVRLFCLVAPSGRRRDSSHVFVVGDCFIGSCSRIIQPCHPLRPFHGAVLTRHVWGHSVYRPVVMTVSLAMLCLAMCSGRLLCVLQARVNPQLLFAQENGPSIHEVTQKPFVTPCPAITCQLPRCLLTSTPPPLGSPSGVVPCRRAAHHLPRPHCLLLLLLLRLLLGLHHVTGRQLLALPHT